VLFGPPGHLYVYFTYGMHFCANVACEPEGTGAGVLLRAIVPEHGVSEMVARRGVEEPRGPAAEQARLLDLTAGDHLLYPVLRDDGSQQDACTRAFGLTGHVGAEMHAVGEVDVQVPGRSEEHCVSRRLAAVPVAAWVVLAVSLGLDDAAADSPEEERGADEVAGDLEGGTGEMALRKGRLRARPPEDGRESASCSALCRGRRR
jgi:hypothetical protein